MEVLQFNKVSVGPPYYNAVFMPVALGLIFLMGVGPYIPWRKTTAKNIKELFGLPLMLGFGAAALLFIFGIRERYALASMTVVAFVAAAIFIDFRKIALFWGKRDGVNPILGFLSAYKRNPRRIAGLITHIGVLVMIIGITFSSLYQTEKILIMKPGDEVSLKSFQLRMARLYGAVGVNWEGKEALFDIYQEDRIITQMRPQKRFYTVSQTPTTETAIYQTNMGHLFVTIPEVSPDGTWARVRVLHNPLVLLVWYGGGIMGIGGFLNIFRRDRKRSAVSVAPGVTVKKKPSPVLASGRDGIVAQRSES
jgi:cytochrome c-type biogenesis protein CcmF